MYKITYKKQAIKGLRRMPAAQASKSFAAFGRIATNDTKGLQIKPLQSTENGHRLRLGGYRAIYTKTDATVLIEIIKIGTRGDIYKRDYPLDVRVKGATIARSCRGVLPPIVCPLALPFWAGFSIGGAG